MGKLCGVLTKCQFASVFDNKVDWIKYLTVKCCICQYLCIIDKKNNKCQI